MYKSKAKKNVDVWKANKTAFTDEFRRKFIFIRTYLKRHKRHSKVFSISAKSISAFRCIVGVCVKSTIVFVACLTHFSGFFCDCWLRKCEKGALTPFQMPPYHKYNCVLLRIHILHWFQASYFFISWVRCSYNTSVYAICHYHYWAYETHNVDLVVFHVVFFSFTFLFHSIYFVLWMWNVQSSFNPSYLCSNWRWRLSYCLFSISIHYNLSFRKFRSDFTFNGSLFSFYFAATFVHQMPRLLYRSGDMEYFILFGNKPEHEFSYIFFLFVSMHEILME